MYTSTFIFEAKPYDDDFHRLNDEIAERARAIPGFLGEETWNNDEAGLGLEHVPAESALSTPAR